MRPELVFCLDALFASPRRAVVIGSERGFDPESRTMVPTVAQPAIPGDVQAVDEADDQQDGENLSFSAGRRLPGTVPKYRR